MAEDLIKSAQDYAASYPAASTHLRKFISHQQTNRPPTQILPLDDLEAKIDALRSIVKGQRVARSDPDFNLIKIQFSFLLRLPLSALQVTQPPGALRPVIDELGPLTNHFLQKVKFVETAKRKRSYKTGSKKSQASGNQPKEATEATEQDELSTTAIDRNPKVVKECRELDGDRCIVTGFANPIICHIVPFAWNNSESNIKMTTQFIPTIIQALNLPGDLDSTRALALLHAKRGSSDEIWNVVALNPMLHTWWSQAYWGFKWVEAEVDPQNLAKTRIHLQFHWMPRNMTPQPTHPIHLDDETDPEKRLSSQLNHSYGSEPIVCNKDNCKICQGTSGVAAYNVHSGRPIRTGDIFTVIRDTDDVNLFHRMIDIQWAIICAAAISGAALAPELLGHLPDRPPLTGFPCDAEVSDGGLSEEDIRKWTEGVVLSAELSL